MRTETGSGDRTAAAAGEGPWWRTTWPIGKRELAVLAVAFVVVVGGFTLVGVLFTDTLAPNAVTDLDDDVAQDFVDLRTPTRTDLATWGAHLSGTLTKVAVSAIVAVATVVVWRRWTEALLIALTLGFEAAAFITITYLVARSRPDVPRLLESPVDSSYPSGHVAAATVYLAFVVIVFWHTRALWARALAVVGLSAVPVVVGVARMYQGMHFLSDVVAGVLLGLVALAICVPLVGRPPDAAARTGGDVGSDRRERTGVEAAGLP